MMRILLRVEGGHQTGMGHVMRCLTLARVLRVKFGARPEFICTQGTARAVKRFMPAAVCHVIRGGNEAQDARQSRLKARGADVVLVDHYGLGWRWEQQMPGLRMAIDDLGRKHAAALLLDGTLPLEKNKYKGKLPAGCTLLRGGAYALLRPGFAQGRQPRGKALRVFMCFGGSDPVDATLWAAKALAETLKGVAVDVAVGTRYAGVAALREFCAQQRWALHVDHAKPEALMAQADLAIGAGGTMTWERCALGLPAVVLSIAENQREACVNVGKLGAMEYAGEFGAVSAPEFAARCKALLADSAARAEMSRRARALVRADGAWHVARHVVERWRKHGGSHA